MIELVALLIQQPGRLIHSGVLLLLLLLLDMVGQRLDVELVDWSATLRRPAGQVRDARERIAAGPGIGAVETGQFGRSRTARMSLRAGPGRRRPVAVRRMIGRMIDCSHWLHFNEGGGHDGGRRRRRRILLQLSQCRFRLYELIQILHWSGDISR